MIIRKDEDAGRDLGGGIFMKKLGCGVNMNALHWDMEDGSEIPMHSHPYEQFGYVISGGFIITIDDFVTEIKAGDAYYIPPNAMHTFRAVGKTEAIDAFSPIKTDIPGE
jgi:quercetin dioxygenase-like cupin family protein